MKPPIRNSAAMQEAFTRACQGGYSPSGQKRLTDGQDAFSFCVGRIGRKQPTHSAPHGIGGHPARGTRIVVVGKSIVVDIAEGGRGGKLYRKRPYKQKGF
jgi:hypothetical protein